jgi:heme ABC exporter ATP-binding subunit CcmA
VRRDVLAYQGPGVMIEITNLTVYRNRIPVLREISLAVRAGEVVAIEGANGAGKTTLLKCLAGAVRPDQGTVTWFGESSRCSRAVRRRIGLVNHECGLYVELTALENLVFAARMHGISPPVERARESLAAAGLGEICNCPVLQLSQGMRQRLAILRSLLHEPRVILLDEPFTSLDPPGRIWLTRLFDQWRRAGRALCFVSHDSARNHDLATAIIRLDAGRITAADPAAHHTNCLRWSA